MYEDALTRLRELGFKQGLVHTLHSLAEVSRAQGANGRSMALHHEALLICRDLGDVCGIAASLEGLAQSAQSDRRFERAARLLAAAAGLREAVGCPLPPAEGMAHERRLAAVRTELGENTFEVTWTDARAMSPGEAVAYALSEPPAN